MVTGIGIDIIEIERIARSIDRFGDRFLNKLFTPEEIAYCKTKGNMYQHFAARFCAKEAVYKAFSQFFQTKISWKNISVTNTFTNRPKVQILLDEWDEIGKGVRIDISLSHSDNYAVCVAIIQRDE